MKKISDNSIDVTDEPTNSSSTVRYISKDIGVFDPCETGTYKLNINGQTIEIDVYDIPDSGVARWTFDNADSESGSAIDVWNNYDGAISGATTGVSGANQTYTTNEAYSFDGTDDYVNSGILFPSGEITISAWIYPENLGNGSNHAIVGAVDGNSNLIQFQYNDSGGGWDWKSYNGSSVVGVTSTSIGTGNNSWYYIVGVFDGSWKIYLDGSQQASVSDSAIYEPNADFFIGSNNNNGSSQFQFDGIIDDVRIYNRGLSDSEVSNLYNTGSISG